jgi:hypothetical protein
VIPDELDEIFDRLQGYLAMVGKEEAEIIRSLLEPLQAWQCPLFLGWLKVVASVISVFKEPLHGKAINPHG